MKKLSDLPKDLIVKMAISFDLPEILHLCQTSKHFNNNICENKYFWVNKYIQDFPRKEMPEDVKSFYKNMIILNNRNIMEQLRIWVFTNVNLKSVNENKKAFKYNGSYIMEVTGNELDLDEEDNYIRLLPNDITLETIVYLPNSICLNNDIGINDDDRGTEDSELEFGDFHDEWRIEKGYRTVGDIANGFYKIKSHKYENWYEWIQSITKYEKTPDCIEISFSIDHGS